MPNARLAKTTVNRESGSTAASNQPVPPTAPEEVGHLTWCPEHGLDVKIDEDGCCIGCGRDAYPLQHAIEEGIAEAAQLSAALADCELREALRVILTAVRGDEKSECWTIRRYLDERNVFNDDIQSELRLVEETCKHALRAEAAVPPRGWQPIASAPKMTYVLVWDGAQRRMGCWHSARMAWGYAGKRFEREPTHWMPLPDPPCPSSGSPEGGEKT